MCHPFFVWGRGGGGGGGGGATKMVSTKIRNVHVNLGLIRLQSDPNVRSGRLNYEVVWKNKWVKL